MVKKNMDSKARLPGFETLPCDLPMELKLGASPVK